MKKIGLYVISAALIALAIGLIIQNGSVIKMNNKKTVQEAVDNIEAEKREVIDKVMTEETSTSNHEINNLTIIALKEEKILEIWYKNVDGNNVFLKQYAITAASGTMGPKLKEGDRQVPEGLYTLEYLNPNSSYHLSMKINYPNDFDRKMALNEGRSNLGGDIFIHGKSASIGCIAIGDPAIEDLFYMVTKVGKDNVNVIVSPLDLRTKDIDISQVNLSWYGGLVDTIKAELLKYQ